MKPKGYGTCECCGATCTEVIRAYDEAMEVHYFCRECCGSGAAIAWLEERAG
jgi:hypothetical protein